MMNDGKIGSDYKPKRINRTDVVCPHCGNITDVRTNRYLFRCNNYEECGRYW